MKKIKIFMGINLDLHRIHNFLTCVSSLVSRLLLFFLTLILLTCRVDRLHGKARSYSHLRLGLRHFPHACPRVRATRAANVTQPVRSASARRTRATRYRKRDLSFDVMAQSSSSFSTNLPRICKLTFPPPLKKKKKEDKNVNQYKLI